MYGNEKTKAALATIEGAVAELGTLAKQMTTDINNLTLIDAGEAAQERGEKYLLVAQHFGYQLPYNRDRMIDEVRHYMGESARTMLEAGARLAMIQTQTTHGEWLDTCAALGLNERTAQRMIKSAKKFGANATTSSHFINFGASKMFELLVLDDDDIGVLVTGGQLENVGTLDAIECMTVSELRAALREAKEDNKAKDNLLTEKTGVITKLQAKAALLPPPTPDEDLKQVRREMSDVTANVEANIRGCLREGFNQLRFGQNVKGENATAFMEGLLEQIIRAVCDTAAAFDIGLAMPNPATWGSAPEWDVDDEAVRTDGDEIDA